MIASPPTWQYWKKNIPFLEFDSFPIWHVWQVTCKVEGYKGHNMFHTYLCWYMSTRGSCRCGCFCSCTQALSASITQFWQLWSGSQWRRKRHSTLDMGVNQAYFRKELLGSCYSGNQRLTCNGEMGGGFAARYGWQTHWWSASLLYPVDAFQWPSLTTYHDKVKKSPLQPQVVYNSL